MNSRLANRRIRALSRNAKSNSYYKMRAESLEKSRELSQDLGRAPRLSKPKRKKSFRASKELPLK